MPLRVIRRQPASRSPSRSSSTRHARRVPQPRSSPREPTSSARALEAVAGAAAHVDQAERSALEAQRQNGGRAGPLRRVHLGHLAGQPARRVEVVDRDVHERGRPAPRPAAGSRVAVRAAQQRELAQLARVERLLEGQPVRGRSGAGSPTCSSTPAAAAAVDRAPRLLELEAERLLAEDVLPGRRRPARRAGRAGARGRDHHAVGGVGSSSSSDVDQGTPCCARLRAPPARPRPPPRPAGAARGRRGWPRAAARSGPARPPPAAPSRGSPTCARGCASRARSRCRTGPRSSRCGTGSPGNSSHTREVRRPPWPRCARRRARRRRPRGRRGRSRPASRRAARSNSNSSTATPFAPARCAWRKRPKPAPEDVRRDGSAMALAGSDLDHRADRLEARARRRTSRRRGRGRSPRSPRA